VWPYKKAKQFREVETAFPRLLLNTNKTKSNNFAPISMVRAYYKAAF